jgi:hypothetical protein
MGVFNKASVCRFVVCAATFCSFCVTNSFGSAQLIVPRNLTATLDVQVKERGAARRNFQANMERILSSNERLNSNVSRKYIKGFFDQIFELICDSIVRSDVPSQERGDDFVSNLKAKIVSTLVGSFSPELFETILPTVDDLKAKLNDRFTVKSCKGFSSQIEQLSREKSVDLVSFVAADLAIYLCTILSDSLYEKMGPDFFLYLNWNGFEADPVGKLSDRVHPRVNVYGPSPSFENRLKLSETFCKDEFKTTPVVMQLDVINSNSCCSYLEKFYKNDFPIFVSLPDIHGGSIWYECITTQLRELRKTGHQVIVVFGGDIERREEPPRKNFIGCDYTIARTCTEFFVPLKKEGFDVIVTLGNHDIQEPARFVCAVDILHAAGIPVITNLKDYFHENVNVLRMTPPEEGICELKKFLSNPTDEYLCQMGLKSKLGHYSILGNTLVFPSVTSFFHVGGGRLTKRRALEIFSGSCYDALSSLYAVANSRQYPDVLLRNGVVNPIVLQTSKIFRDALVDLAEQNQYGNSPLNLVIAAHENPVRTLKFFQFCSLFNPIPEAILDRLSITMMTGHEHHIFDFYTTLSLFCCDGATVVPVNMGCSVSGRGHLGFISPYWDKLGVMSLHLLSEGDTPPDMSILSDNMVPEVTGVMQASGGDETSYRYVEISDDEKNALFEEFFTPIDDKCETSTLSSDVLSLQDILKVVSSKPDFLNKSNLGLGSVVQIDSDDESDDDESHSEGGLTPASFSLADGGDSNNGESHPIGLGGLRRTGHFSFAGAEDSDYGDSDDGESHPGVGFGRLRRTGHISFADLDL